MTHPNHLSKRYVIHGKGTLASRAKSRRVAGPYYNTRPRTERADSLFFYMDSHGQMGDGPIRLRFDTAESMQDLRHTGYYCDEDGHTVVHGIVARLPHGRGFLAGWSMGDNMASELSREVHLCERDAALAADAMAEEVAGSERDKEREFLIEHTRADLADAQATVARIVDELKAALIAVTEVEGRLHELTEL